MRGVYLASKEHSISGYDIVYNDIIPFSGIDLVCDMLNVDLNDYDFIIATPPCNYYSRANYRRDVSKVALETKHLLPTIIKRCEALGKPFIIENVCNSTLLPKSNSYEFEFGNHHFYTNVFIFTPDKSYSVKQHTSDRSYGKRDGNYNVDLIIRLFLEVVCL